MARTPLPADRDVVVVDAARTPFLKSNGAFAGLMSWELGREAIKGLLARTGLSPRAVDLVVMGTVVQDPRTSNLAREAMLGAGLPHTVPAFTTTLACISANVAATTAAESIQLGRADVAIVGGAESFSDPPIRLSKNLRRALVKSQKVKAPQEYMKILADLSPQDLVPDVPSAAEFSTGLTMGQSCERLAHRVGVSRRESDEWAVRSHVLADQAWKDGRYADEVVPVAVPPAFALVTADDGPRSDSTMETAGKLKPAFDRDFGVVTAASSSFLTDGGSAVLLMSAEKARQLGHKSKAILRDWVYAAGDPLEELLAGPALTIPKILARNNLTARDVGVWEIHEAFAAQVVANLKLLDDQTFLRERVGVDMTIGEIPLERINAWGGSLSLGHPFGATGGRLIATASRRLKATGHRYAVLTGCAAGGHGSAILLENPAAVQ
ncbi:MAG: acetyl-CoA C-acyltransferase [Deltaproteobacteria bacterium]|nr:acetyl-CoA C-acyltransferase [Deltaproteobacteria bacterium]